MALISGFDARQGVKSGVKSGAAQVVSARVAGGSFVALIRGFYAKRRC